MNDDMTPFAETISDEAAFALSETLHWLALVCEAKYLGQIRRHIAVLDKARSVDSDRPWNTDPPSQ